MVLFEGFGNRLAFDPVPFDIQVLSFTDRVHQLYFGQKLWISYLCFHASWTTSEEVFKATCMLVYSEIEMPV